MIKTLLAVVLLGVYTYALLRFGYYMGKKRSPLANSEQRQQLNRDAYKLINGLCITDDINTDDVITEKTRRECNAWLSQFLKVEKRY